MTCPKHGIALFIFLGSIRVLPHPSGLSKEKTRVLILLATTKEIPASEVIVETVFVLTREYNGRTSNILHLQIHAERQLRLTRSSTELLGKVLSQCAQNRTSACGLLLSFRAVLGSRHFSGG